MTGDDAKCSSPFCSKRAGHEKDDDDVCDDLLATDRCPQCDVGIKQHRANLRVGHGFLLCVHPWHESEREVSELRERFERVLRDIRSVCKGETVTVDYDSGALLLVRELSAERDELRAWQNEMRISQTVGGSSLAGALAIADAGSIRPAELTHTCINTTTTLDGRPSPPCAACHADPEKFTLQSLLDAHNAGFTADELALIPPPPAHKAHFMTVELLLEALDATYEKMSGPARYALNRFADEIRERTKL